MRLPAPAATILTTIEAGDILDNPDVMQIILSSLNPLPPGAPAPDSILKNFMADFLTVINNWEKATGHRIKNPEGNITGTVRVQQNGVKAQTAMN